MAADRGDRVDHLGPRDRRICRRPSDAGPSGTATATTEWARKAHAAGNFGAVGRDRRSIGKDDRRRPMQFLDAPLGVGAQIELRIARERGFEFRGDELGKVAAHALGHAALGFARDPDEQRDLQHERDREEENEAESDAPVEAARERSGWSGWSRHQRTCNRCPRPSG